ncbi:MAG: MazG nucleotide pyrophosphohydrolase domain-containing protein [Planctomycetota bacterium]
MNLDPIFEQIATLRHPQTGCPWDLSQTLEAYLDPIAGEAGELVEALQSGNRAHIREEAGDLLWNLCFVIALAEEEGAFTREDVLHDVVAKMRHRHPHVYGEEIARTPDDALAAFRRAKAREKDAPNKDAPPPKPAPSA